MFADSDDDDVGEECATRSVLKRSLEDQKRVQDKLNNLPTLEKLMREEDPNAFTNEQVIEAAEFVHELIALQPSNNKEIDKCQRKLQQKFHKSFKKSLLLSGYKHLLTNGKTHCSTIANIATNDNNDDTSTSLNGYRSGTNLQSQLHNLNQDAIVDLEELVSSKQGQEQHKTREVRGHKSAIDKDSKLTSFTSESVQIPRYLPLEHYLVSKAPRSQSGVLVVTVFTSPYPDGQKFSCQWNCYYCPNEPGQPRSYLLNEPGVRRANRLAFDPVRQFHERVHSLIAIGHPADKIELMVLGGTWESYPRSYRERFMRDLFYAANTVFDEVQCNNSITIREDVTNTNLNNNNNNNNDVDDKNDSNPNINKNKFCDRLESNDKLKAIPEKLELEEEELEEEYCNAAVKQEHVNTAYRRRPPLDLAQEQMLNETAMCKIIGVTLETRPDTITPEMLCELRRLGCTRLQLGVQHTDDGILEYVNRQCTREDTMRALKLLKDSCFKVDIHLMPDLPGSSPEIDKAMFDDVLHEPNLQADQWKIYPCQTTPFTVIEEWYKAGKYTPYGLDALIEVLLYAKRNVHPWIRLNRVIRDIPIDYVLAGVEVSNLRQLLAVKLKQNNEYCKCIRCREVKGDTQVASKLASAQLIERTYNASEGTEIFLSFETPDERTIFAFLRLRINIVNSDCPFVELEHCALIRELHVYGNLITTYGEGNLAHRAQHSGLGTRLLARAESIATNAGYNKIAVISGIGVRDYYRRKGYRLDNTFDNHGGFMIKDLTNSAALNSAQLECINNKLHHNIDEVIQNNNNEYDSENDKDDKGIVSSINDKIVSQGATTFTLPITEHNNAIATISSRIKSWLGSWLYKRKREADDNL